MAERDPEVVQAFVEQFASALIDAGVSRMPARVFSVLYATDSGRLTANEIAEKLQVSPAAISGAVRFLVQYNLVRRERQPGSRRDHYVVDSDSWYVATVKRDTIMRRWAANARQGVEVLGADTPAGQRMAETVEFFEFIIDELHGLVERWEKTKAERRAAAQGGG